MNKIIFKSKRDILQDVPKNFYDLQCLTIDKDMFKFNSLREKGRLFLLINVASKCYFTQKNYEQLQVIQDKYEDKGLMILLFPCNQFMNQEKDSNEDIKQFIQKYSDKFLIFDKIDINGNSTHEVYKFLRFNSVLREGESDKTKMIPWNFSKFIVNQEGEVVKYYPSDIYPYEMMNDIDQYLQQIIQQ